MAAATTTDAMKEFVCCIMNDGTTPDQITESNVTLLWNRICEEFGTRFNGAAAVGNLSVSCREGSASRTTHVTISGSETITDGTFRYSVGTNVVLPKAGDDVSAWAEVPESYDIPATDGQKVCVSQADADGLVVKAGMSAAIVAI